MKRIISEEAVLFIAVIKWVILASTIGILVGSATACFLKLLTHYINICQAHPYSFLLLPLAFLISTLLTVYLLPEASGHGTEKVIEAIHKKSGRINLMVVPVKAIATIITIAVGGSAGKEGPCAQIGGGLASSFSDIFRFSDIDRKKVVICGISAGFASVFGTPIAGAIFGVEVLFVGNILYEVLLPSIIAGITSFYASTYFGVPYFYFPINNIPNLSEAFFLKTLLSGLFFGFCSVFLIMSLKTGEKIYKKLKYNRAVKSIIGGVLLSVIALVFSTKYLGLGLNTINESLNGANISWYDFILKTVATSITLNFGGSGGIITPIFFIGATSGALYAKLFALDITVFSAIGMVSLLGGAANTPIAASILAIEMFGPQIAPYAAIACIISFLITGHRSVFPSQILAIRKSPYINVETGKRVDNLILQTKLINIRLVRQMHQVYKLFRKIINRK